VTVQRISRDGATRRPAADTDRSDAAPWIPDGWLGLENDAHGFIGDVQVRIAFIAPAVGRQGKALVLVDAQCHRSIMPDCHT
jgi:hypothetical protein